MTHQEKKEIIAKFATHKGDTGSPQVQIAIITNRINGLVGHLDLHKKDNHSRRGLLMLVGKRKKLIRYLEETNKAEYIRISQELNLRYHSDEQAKAKVAAEKSEADKVAPAPVKKMSKTAAKKATKK